MLMSSSSPDVSYPSVEHSIFHENWWMDAATDGNYETLEIRNGGNIVSDFHYCRKKHLGMRYIIPPPYTRTLGPRFFLPASKPFRRGQKIRNIVAELIRKLPKYDHLKIRLDPSDDSAFAFSICGLQIRNEFTFRIAPDVTPGVVLEQCDQKTRNLIRSASQKLEVTQSADIEAFIRMSLVDQSASENRHDFATMAKLFEACLRHDRACVISAYDEKKKQVSSSVLIWDEKNLYYWLSARDRNASIPGANMLLIWEALKLASAKALTFDFDSFASVGTAKMLASFGQPPVLRPHVIGASVRYEWERAANATLMSLRDYWKRKIVA